MNPIPKTHGTPAAGVGAAKMRTAEIGSVPEVLLPSNVLPWKSSFLYRSMDAMGLRVSDIPIPRPAGAEAPNAIVGADARYRDVEYCDRSFVAVLRARYQDEEATFESAHKKTDQMLNDFHETLLAMNRRVLDITKVTGAKPVHLPSPQRFPSRPQESPPVASGDYSIPRYSGEHVKTGSAPTMRHPYWKDYTASQKANLMKSIHRRLWKYDLRIAQHWKTLQSIEERLDDRLGLLRQRLGWAEELTSQLSDVEKHLRSLAPAAVIPKNSVAKQAVQVPRWQAVRVPRWPPPDHPAVRKPNKFYEDADSSQQAPLSYSTGNFEFHTLHYVYRHVPDPDIDGALTIQLHNQCAMIQSRQMSLWYRFSQMRDWIDYAHETQVQRQTRIRTDFTETAARIDGTLRELETKTGIAARSMPKVRSLVQFHGAEIEKAGSRS
jgi:hypothetical protein